MIDMKYKEQQSFDQHVEYPQNGKFFETAVKPLDGSINQLASRAHHFGSTWFCGGNRITPLLPAWSSGHDTTTMADPTPRW